MASRAILVAVGVLALVGAAQSAVAAPVVYDVTADWSDASNPSGVWSYNDGDGPITNQVANWPSHAPFPLAQPVWADAATGSGHIVAWFRATNDAFDWLTGDVVVHTWDAQNGGSSAPHANLTWTSPGAGTVDVAGAVWLTRDIGRAVDWSLAIDGLTVSGGALFSGDPYSRADPFDLADGFGGAGVLGGVAVAPGDVVQLSFLTASVNGDLVGLDFSVAFTPVPVPLSALLFAPACCALLRRRRRA